MPRDAGDVVHKTLVAEGASEGEEGMYHIASTMVNRGAKRKLSLAQVVNQPFQYTGRWRKDLDDFVTKQPEHVHIAAANALTRAKSKPATSATHYLTTSLFRSSKRPAWANSPRMKRLGVVGRHMFFEEH